MQLALQPKAFKGNKENVETVGASRHSLQSFVNTLILSNLIIASLTMLSSRFPIRVSTCIHDGPLEAHVAPGLVVVHGLVGDVAVVHAGDVAGAEPGVLGQDVARHVDSAVDSLEGLESHVLT